jgi:hypothetical protein
LKWRGRKERRSRRRSDRVIRTSTKKSPYPSDVEDGVEMALKIGKSSHCKETQNRKSVIEERRAEENHEPLLESEASKIVTTPSSK